MLRAARCFIQVKAFVADLRIISQAREDRSAGSGSLCRYTVVVCPMFGLACMLMIKCPETHRRLRFQPIKRRLKIYYNVLKCTHLERRPGRITHAYNAYFIWTFIKLVGRFWYLFAQSLSSCLLPVFWVIYSGHLLTPSQLLKLISNLNTIRTVGAPLSHDKATCKLLV